jgi:UDP-GlcNAc:undecaprenyl-phosphate/decaprenyl-phosphate GlcNAc-1-phosphate transferase
VSFPLHVYLPATLGACFITLLTLPLWRNWCLRHGLVDDPGYRKIHHQTIPLAGGLAVITGLAIPVLFGALYLACRSAPAPEALAGADIPHLLRHGLDRRYLELGAILLGALGMLFVGCWDDKYELRPGVKFAGQFLVAALVAAGGARITLFVPNVVFHYAVTILWILTVINALNFMDNMNGLCAGLGAIAAWSFGVLAAAQGQYLVAIIALLTFGALLGFLPFNFPRARVFLGDGGSHLVGYLLAVLAILPHFYTPLRARPLAVLIPLLVLAVPLADMAYVVVLRWRLGKPFYIGDTNHLSHRLVRKGFSQTLAVLLIWLLAALSGLLACLLS